MFISDVCRNYETQLRELSKLIERCRWARIDTIYESKMEQWWKRWTFHLIVSLISVANPQWSEGCWTFHGIVLITQISFDRKYRWELIAFETDYKYYFNYRECQSVDIWPLSTFHCLKFEYNSEWYLHSWLMIKNDGYEKWRPQLNHPQWNEYNGRI